MREYCAITDRGYLPKFLALHDSLMRHSSKEFELHVLCLDECWRILEAMRLRAVTIRRVTHIDSLMKFADSSRTYQEWAWTLASQFMEYLLPKHEAVTYLDSDLFFFANPNVIFDEIADRSIGITPHRFPPEKKYMEKNGIFNVGLVYARNNLIGRRCIEKWAAQVRERCSAEIGCGDQKYLDAFIPDYGAAVCAIKNIGVNLAPWNVSNWSITQGPRVGGIPVTCYHMHEFANEERLTFYPLRVEDREFIYAPYINVWKEMKLAIENVEAALKLRNMEAQWERA